MTIERKKDIFRQTAVFLIGITIFLSSFLLFLVQPMISKYFLPWFGGISSVWTVAVLFFQCSLLLGYYYSCVLSKKRLSFQFVFHGLFIVAILIVALTISRGWPSSITPGVDFKSFSSQPVSGLLVLLSISVGLPYIVLSATSPLLQQWIGQLFFGDKAYRFYRLSNLGSFAGLLSYPLFFEPYLTLYGQAKFWFGLFILEIGLLIGTVWIFRKHIISGKKEKSSEENKSENKKIEAGKISRKTIRSWIFLAAIPSIMMLALTNYLTQGITPFPLLWLVPLALYLFSFIVCFKESFRPSIFYVVTLFIGSTATLLFIGPISLGSENLIFKFLVLSATLFSCSIICHWRLYISRPNFSQLTTFYLVVAIGGALGGFFAGIIAPIIFCEYFEIQISILAAAYILFKSLPMIGAHRKFFGNGVVILTFRLFIILAMIIGVLLSLNLSSNTDGDKIVDMKRNFYGKLVIRKNDQYMKMYNGQILHGLQASDEKDSLKPSSYYSSDSGIGLAFRLKNEIKKETGDSSSLKVGVIGLGVGTVAAFCSEGDNFVFYEINPDVIAAEEKYFVYLKNCPESKIVIGDARISLEKELASGSNEYDILAVDAFTDDAIPVHLLTKEAVQLYLKHLSGDGILAFHISNRNINLEPVLASIANNLKLSATIVDIEQDKDPKKEKTKNADGGIFFKSKWVLISRNSTVLKEPFPQKTSRPIHRSDKTRVWTDNYSNILTALQW